MAEDSSGGLLYARGCLRGECTSELQYSNPCHQRVGPRWVQGDVVYGMPMGIVDNRTELWKWASEYVSVNKSKDQTGRPERVPGQYRIYDSKPDDANYSPICGYNYGIVPRDCVAKHTQVRRRVQGEWLSARPD